MDDYNEPTRAEIAQENSSYTTNNDSDGTRETITGKFNIFY